LYAIKEILLKEHFEKIIFFSKVETSWNFNYVVGNLLTASINAFFNIVPLGWKEAGLFYGWHLKFGLLRSYLI
jgi:hypothetical protein